MYVLTCVFVCANGCLCHLHALIFTGLSYFAFTACTVPLLNECMYVFMSVCVQVSVFVCHLHALV